MKWFEVVEDCGDGTAVTRRFKTKEEANQYPEENENWVIGSVDEVDTDSEYFWD